MRRAAAYKGRAQFKRATTAKNALNEKGVTAWEDIGDELPVNIIHGKASERRDAAQRGAVGKKMIQARRSAFVVTVTEEDRVEIAGAIYEIDGITDFGPGNGLDVEFAITRRKQ